MAHMNNKVLIEAKRLHALGFAIHWLHPNSKRPVESAWTTGPRKDWKYLKDTYSEALNVGVRLGSASAIGSKGFLAVIDVDVKSTEEKHRKEAIAAARELLKGAACPVVLSGRGNGSRHYYCTTEAPFKPFDYRKSKDIVKVHMPSARPSKKEIETLTPTELASGIRLRAAWEISLMSEGRQVVLPPSIHPDSNKPYTWKESITNISALPLVQLPTEAATESEPSEKREASSTRNEKFEFEVSPVQLDWLEVSDRIKDGIRTGAGVEDRSSFLLPACTALLSAGCSRDEILTILTEPDTFLGACAYEHAQTKDRTRAARWLWRYTLKRVMSERSAELAFANAAEIEPRKVLSESEQKKQNAEIESQIDWRDSLDRTEKGKYRATLNNCKAILMNVADTPNIVGRDEFSVNDYYLTNAPWRSRAGKAVTDIDIVRIKCFCAESFGVEFSDGIIDQALQDIADRNRFHPVRDWLNSLKWDGVNRIDTWLKDYAGADAPEPYLSDVSRKFLVAMVARIFEPGVKFDTILILEGNQGTGKSTLLARLAGGKWFTDAALSIGDKDAVLTIQSKWLVELGELSSMSKADLEIFKAFVAQRTDRIRAPYGKRVEEFPRQSVFTGTTNLDEYLRDLTGNRRFWTVKLLNPKIDFDGVSEIREQLFAEAVAMYRMGEPLYLENEESEAQARGEQAQRLQVDEWLSTVVEVVTGENFPTDSFEIKDVAKLMDQFGAHRMTPADVQRIARCLKIMGCDTYRESRGQRRRLWRYVEDQAERNQMKVEKFEKREKTDKRKKLLKQWKEKNNVVQRRPVPSDDSLDENSPMETEF